jgi:hypothetical protein
MKKSDRAVALLFVGLAGLVLAQSLELPFGTLRAPQSGFFPTVLAALLLIVSLALAAQGFFAPVEQRRAPDRIAAEGWVRIGATLAAMAGFALALERLGFFLATFALMVLLLRAIESQSWFKVIAIAVAAAVFSQALFGWLLGIPLPAGILGI